MNYQHSNSAHVSAADIIIPKQFEGPPPGQPSRNADHMTPADVHAFFDDLYALKFASGANTSKHDVVRNLIWACIERGVNTGPRILGAVSEVGYEKSHIAIILKQETGSDRSRHWWRRDAEGRYSLHY